MLSLNFTSFLLCLVSISGCTKASTKIKSKFQILWSEFRQQRNSSKISLRRLILIRLLAEVKSSSEFSNNLCWKKLMSNGKNSDWLVFRNWTIANPNQIAKPNNFVLTGSGQCQQSHLWSFQKKQQKHFWLFLQLNHVQQGRHEYQIVTFFFEPWLAGHNNPSREKVLILCKGWVTPFDQGWHQSTYKITGC